MEVKVWKEKIKIPTYEVGEPEKNPIFLEKRVYQGSSGVVYPNPVIEKIYDEKILKEWLGIFLENKYLKIMILPELGGRVQMAFDKIKQRHFVYYNQVIKPALVGLTGPWISGGIEFNWPQHHRPSTYEPVDFTIEENEDGSKTIWVSEIERMFRAKGMAGFTLYPDKAYMEIKVKLFNRTQYPQTFLWWANPAVSVNDHYQSIFPPDVNAVFDHGKRDVSSFPIATGTYYKVDYSSGIDISRYKNIPVPTSYMAITSKYNFVGGYENDTNCGLLHVANHHVSPGKKQWTWGNGEFGQAWDRNLTDEDGPYIELMCGVYTDNQPDFSWLQPYEEKSFNQYFMPYHDIGMVKNATKEAILNLEFEDGKAKVKVYTTSEYKKAKIIFKGSDEIYFEEITDLKPESLFKKVQDINSQIPEHEFYVAVIDSDNNILVDFTPERQQLKPMPDPAKAAKNPEEIVSTEQLYLTGLHIEQYRHATYNSIDYYQEAIKREPTDVRNNNALGLWLLRRGQFKKAEAHFRVAIKTLTERNPNPYDGEPFFNLGICLKFQGRNDEAYEVLYKATWNSAWSDSAYFQLAQIACCNRNFDEALDLINRSLWKNYNNHSARVLKAVILRKLNKENDLKKIIDESLALDKFNFGILYEKYLLDGNKAVLIQATELMRDYVHNYIELSLEYGMAGFYDDAVNILNIFINDKKDIYPMISYFMGWYFVLLDKNNDAMKYFKKASESQSDYCFPSRLEELIALQCAVKHNNKDAKAYYYMGNFWYANRQYKEATDCWEKSKELDDKFSITHRNLALVYFNKYNRFDDARYELKKAFELDKTPRNLMELDQLYKKLNYPYQLRLDLLEKNIELVDFRDDLYLERVTLYNILGNEKKALELINYRKFHPWEGGEGKVSGQYIMSNIEIAKYALENNEYSTAITHLENAKEYPENLGEGKLFGTQENDINYWLGIVYEKIGELDKAKEYWKLASMGLSEPNIAIYYNDQSPDKIYYQGLALKKLNDKANANSRFNKLLKYGEKHIFDTIKIDYFAVSFPDLLIFEYDLNQKHKIHCKYMMALGNMGLGKIKKAMDLLDEILESDKYHLGALIHKKLLFNVNSI